MRKMIFAVIILNGLIGCDYYTSVLEIENRTDRIIIFDFSRADTLEARPPYTLSDFKRGLKNIDGNESSCFIAPRSIHREFRSSWSAAVDRDFSGFLRIFIFDPDTLQKYEWSDVRNKNRYVHKFKFSTDALRRMNWRIEFSDSLRTDVSKQR